MNCRHKTASKQLKKGILKLPKKSPPKTLDPEVIMQASMKTSDAENTKQSGKAVALSGKDALTMMVTLKGSRWAYIENYSYIADYNAQMIKIMGKEQMVVLEGRQLSIVYFTEDDLLLCGRILSVRYL